MGYFCNETLCHVEFVRTSSVPFFFLNFVPGSVLDGTVSTLRCPVLISPGRPQQHMGPRAAVQGWSLLPLLIWKNHQRCDLAYVNSNCQMFNSNMGLFKTPGMCISCSFDQQCLIFSERAG